MAETYDILFENEPVGTACVGREGLYLSFTCRCRLPADGLYRIHAICEEQREDLGICIPIGGMFGMDKKIPAKRMGKGTLTFELVPKDWKPQPAAVEAEEQPQQAEASADPEPAKEQFISVSEEEPFAYLDKLDHARMELHDDQPGIVIDEIAEG